MGNMDVVHQTLPSPCLKVKSATSQNILVFCFGVKNHLKVELSVPSGLRLQAWPGPSTSWLTSCSRRRRGSRRLRCEIFLGSDFPESDMSLRFLLLWQMRLSCYMLPCFFPFFIITSLCYMNLKGESFFVSLVWAIALCPQKWQKSHFQTVTTSNAWWKKSMLRSIAQINKKKSVFYSRYFVVSLLSEMRIHTEGPAGGNRGQFPQPIKFTVIMH